MLAAKEAADACNSPTDTYLSKLGMAAVYPLGMDACLLTVETGRGRAGLEGVRLVSVRVYVQVQVEGCQVKTDQQKKERPGASEHIQASMRVLADRPPPPIGCYRVCGRRSRVGRGTCHACTTPGRPWALSAPIGSSNIITPACALSRSHCATTASPLPPILAVCMYGAAAFTSPAPYTRWPVIHANTLPSPSRPAARSCVALETPTSHSRPELKNTTAPNLPPSPPPAATVPRDAPLLAPMIAGLDARFPPAQ